MAGRTGFRAYPKHLPKPDGRGLTTCDASGFLRKPADMMDDRRQGRVARDKADTTPGFGTHHPQDVVQLGVLDDPRSTGERPADTVNATSADLGYTDADVWAAVRSGRPLGSK